jgi:hypothetical protein
MNFNQKKQEILQVCDQTYHVIDVQLSFMHLWYLFQYILHSCNSHSLEKDIISRRN